MSFLLDTSVISELVKPSPNDNVVEWMKRADETSLYLSVLTIGELEKGIAKLPLHASQRHPQGFRCFLIRKSQKELQLDDGAPVPVRRRHIVEQTVDGQGQFELLVSTPQKFLQAIDGDSRPFRPASRVVDQQAAHRAGGDGKKVRPVPPIPLASRQQPAIGLVQQRRGLKGMVGPLPPHHGLREFAEIG